MEIKHVRDVMLNLDRVPKIHRDKTLLDAIRVLDVAQEKRPGGRLPYRALLVVDDEGNVIGKLGHLAFLSALEPGYESPGALAAMDRAGVDPELVASMSGHMRLLEPGFPDCCRRAAHIRVGDVMRPLDDHVDEDMLLISAASKMVRLQTLSILVRRGEEVVGLLRLADLFDVIADVISSDDCESQAGHEGGDDAQGSSS